MPFRQESTASLAAVLFGLVLVGHQGPRRELIEPDEEGVNCLLVPSSMLVEERVAGAASRLEISNDELAPPATPLDVMHLRRDIGTGLARLVHPRTAVIMGLQYFPPNPLYFP